MNFDVVIPALSFYTSSGKLDLVATRLYAGTRLPDLDRPLHPLGIDNQG